MKVYVIVIDEVFEFETFDHRPEVFSVFDDAKKRFDDIVEQAKIEFLECGWEENEGAGFFETWPDGYWGTSHYSVNVYTVDLQ